MAGAIQSCAEALSLSVGKAAHLLFKHHWNIDTAIAAYLDVPQQQHGVKQAPSAELVCGICTMSVAVDSTFSLDCEHRFCLDCWSMYISHKVSDTALALYATCPQPDCANPVFLDEVRLLADDKAFQKFNDELFRSFVTHSDHLFWCKNPKGCGGIVSVDSHEAVVTCEACHFTFCAKCEYSAHAPASCAQMKAWDVAGGYQDLSEEESMVRKLKLEITRPCPKCGASIEKNGGCPHMVCSIDWSLSIVTSSSPVSDVRLLV